jgi:hypothetical protein
MAVAFAVIERRAPSDTLATVTICLVTDTSRLRLAGYNGEVSLGAAGRVVHVERPPGGTRIENTRVPGHVAFAGVAAVGFPPGPVLSLTVAHLRPADDSSLRLTLLDVTDVDGRDVVSRVRVESAPRHSTIE